MNNAERNEWRKEVYNVARSLRRERTKKQKQKQEINKRLEVLNTKKYSYAGKQKQKEIRASAYSKPLTLFGLKMRKKRLNYFTTVSKYGL